MKFFRWFCHCCPKRFQKNNNNANVKLNSTIQTYFQKHPFEKLYLGIFVIAVKHLNTNIAMQQKSPMFLLFLIFFFLKYQFWFFIFYFNVIFRNVNFYLTILNIRMLNRSNSRWCFSSYEIR